MLNLKNIIIFLSLNIFCFYNLNGQDKDKYYFNESIELQLKKNNVVEKKTKQNFPDKQLISNNTKTPKINNIIDTNEIIDDTNEITDDSNEDIVNIDDTINNYSSFDLKRKEFFFDTINQKIQIVNSEDSIKSEYIIITNANLFKNIILWLGNKYKYAGTGINGSGIDCSSLTQQLQKNSYNNSIPRTAIQQYKNSKKIEPSELKEGDLVFFKIRKKYISHVGLYLDKNYFIHASTSQGVTIGSLNDPYYHKRVVGYGTYEKQIN